VPDRKTATSAPARHHSTWVVAAGAMVVAAGAVTWWGQPSDGRAVVVNRVEPGASAGPAAGTTARPVRAPRKPGAPRLVRIPALDVAAPVVPVQAPGRTLVPPADPQRLGWWADGAEPGAREGSVLIAGHTVHTGGGALDDLEELQAGDSVVVRTDRGTIRYAVRQVRIYGKGSLADRAARVFRQDGPGRLVLITCEDWDGIRYRSNVVVTAAPRR
jgi:LPXTG-site transpeptidase (sortase) family protein